MNGDLTAEFSYENGVVQTGLKEYLRNGSLVTDYPEIRFREVDRLKDRNRIDLEIYCERKGINVKYYRMENISGLESRTYLISENGQTSLQFYIHQGERLNEIIRITAEIPTELGNIMVKQLTYHLSASNP
jgi:antitoxin component YwqK of YwqJK toxin-antitoxin module